MKILKYKNACRIKWKNKRATVGDRSDRKGYMLHFAKMNDDTELGVNCTSEVIRGVRYTTLSLSHEAMMALCAAGMERIKNQNQKL
jgi:hypothetical protein